MTNINLLEVLSESFELLVTKPKLFVPKLFSAIIGAFWFFGVLEGVGSTIYYLASLPFLTFIGFFVSVMVAGMVKNSESDKLLKKGFEVGLENFQSVIVSTFLLMAAALLISLPLSMGIFYYMVAGNVTALALGGFITLLTSLLLSFTMYFYPIGLADKNSVLKGLKASKSTAFSNRKEVTILTLISFILLVIAATSQNYFKTLGYAGFIGGRLLSAVVTTYLFVVSPKYYLE